MFWVKPKWEIVGSRWFVR